MIRKSLEVLCVLGQVPLVLGTMVVVAAHAPTARAEPTKPSTAEAAPASGAAAPGAPATGGHAGAPVPPPAPAAASGAVAASSGPPVPAGVPKPPAEMEQMKVLEGSWRCEGRA